MSLFAEGGDWIDPGSAARREVAGEQRQTGQQGPQLLHGFAAYWRMIYPGSALIRRMWLRAIKRRAEGGIGGGRDL
ncbi:MAG TPA: hypothetical protein VE959_00970 [Bryobacteraceae bacterium]|nr:hypothetical protein [Bryobacteraceae bacterium]